MTTGNKWAKVRRWGLIGAAGIAGATAAQLAIPTGAMLREVFKYPEPVQDGPDPLVAAPTHPMRSSVVGTRDGTLLHVVASGDVDDSDEILVLIHGWTCNTGFWNPQFNHFGGTRPMVAYDQRGHGLSELGSTKPSVEMLGQDLQAVLEAMIPEGKRAVLVGHSMGGMTIMSWAKQFGAGMEDRVSAIVLCSTAARGVVQRQHLIPDDVPALARPGKRMLERLFTSSRLPLPSNALTAKFSHYITVGPVARQAHVDFTDEMVSACSPKARGAWGSAMYTLDVLAGLDKVTVPTAVVVGDADLLTPVEHAQEMAKALSSRGFLHSYTVYEGAGHMVPFERAVPLNALLDDLLSDVSAATGS
ncbi:alpha/beta fold hydrolase [Gordonia neofelifaecis]|uniref:Alpha/beta hydrolase fold protein n=1 Tax=Gordonia neofelifaecis NRRL B-59395 TaxID=644548 RepID=F1YLJ8_9ACTN|nr:alpha/beta fold hydrolase [Gordonia neofelifaecis]EGD54392.1 alpha/beta hydrolase fold protein [Gordonia neofelifaecis NRRL B-59395]